MAVLRPSHVVNAGTRLAIPISRGQMFCEVELQENRCYNDKTLLMLNMKFSHGICIDPVGMPSTTLLIK